MLPQAHIVDTPTAHVHDTSTAHPAGVCLDFPAGGTESIIGALVRGVTKHRGCELMLNTHVDELLFGEGGGRCTGVRLKGGRTLRATKAVVSNADLWTTRKLVGDVFFGESVLFTKLTLEKTLGGDATR